MQNQTNTKTKDHTHTHTHKTKSSPKKAKYKGVAEWTKETKNYIDQLKTKLTKTQIRK